MKIPAVGTGDVPDIGIIGDVPPGNIQDILSAQRESVDLSSIVQQQFEATNQLLETLSDRVKGLVIVAGNYGDAFKTAAESIEKSAAATDKLADSTKKVGKGANDSRASIVEMLKALSQGNIGGAIAEGFQGIPGTVKARAALAARAKLMRGTAAEAETGIGRGLALRAGALGLGAVGGLMTPAAIYGAYRLAGQVNAQQRDTLQLGQLTGEGRGAGLAAGGINLPVFGRIGGEASALRGSPFDLIGNKEAMEIVRGTRGAGFRGAEARNTEEAIANMVNDLGIGVSDAMAIAIPAIKDAGISTSDLAEQMSTLDDTSKSSRIGIQDLTKSIGELISNLATQSRAVASTATGTTQNLLGQFQGTLAGRSPGTFSALQQGTQREALAQLSGFAPFEAYTPQFSQNFQANFTRLLVQLAKGKPEGVGWNLYVHELLLNPMYQQLFGNTPVPQIIDMLRVAWDKSNHGRNTQRYIDRQATENRSRNAAQALRETATRTHRFFEGKESFWTSHVDKSIIRRRGQRAEANVERVIDTLGLSSEQRDEILGPIRKAIKSSDRGSLEKALKEADNKVADMQKDGKIHVHTTVGFDPRSARMLRQLNTGSIETLRGNRGSQGTNIEH